MPLRSTFSLDRDDLLSAMIGRYPDFYGQYTELHLSGGEYRGKCPLHGGQRDSFSLNPENGLWHCHSECDEGGDVFDFLNRKEGLEFTDALEAVAKWSGTSPQPYSTDTAPRSAGKRVARHISSTYSYTDEAGELLFQAVRYEPKDFSQRRPAGNGTWIYSLAGVHRVLYRLPEVVAGVSTGRAIFICEGEKDADALAGLGLTATTAPMGAGNWEEAYTETLCGACVVLLPDNDKAGRDHVRKVAQALSGRAKRVRIVDLPGLPEKGDVSDWIEAGGTKAALMELVKAAPDWKPGAPEKSTISSVEAWELPVTFSTQKLPPFPLEALPTSLATFVSEVAASVQVPLDMPGLMALGVVGAASARTCLVEVGDTHSEPMNLFCAIVMEPGSRKTSALQAMDAPLREAERDMVAAAMPRILEAQETRAIEDKRLMHLREQAAKAKPGDDTTNKSQEVANLANSLTQVPVVPRLLADDVTPEAAANLTAEQGGALALVSAEGGLFGILAGRYTKGGIPNLDLFLKGHAGESVRIDRKGSPGLSIPRVCLSLLLAIQPGVLTSLAETPAFGERGLVARFLFSIPDNLVGTRFYSNRRIDERARAAYHAAIRAIIALPIAATEDDPGARHGLRIEGEALKIWTQFADDVERRQAEGGDLSALKYWASKLAGAVARIAGGFHLVENASQGCPWTRPLTPKTVAAAWCIGQYLISHALAAYGDMGDNPNAKLARRLLTWIERNELAEFTLRECHQSYRSHSQTELTAGLGLLCERGYIRLTGDLKKVGPGRPKSTTYICNPLLKITQNTQN